MSDGLDMTPDPDSDGCLCVVTSYVSAARTIDEVTTEAAKRAMMSPVLSDFIEFRFADLGPQPGQPGDGSAAVRRITDAVLNQHSSAGRNYFAVVVVDRSAVVAEQVLSGCAASPFLAPLRMRFLGISNADDRPGRGLVKEPGPLPDIVTSPTGVWSKKEDLVDVLRQFADELQRHFSARPEPGLSAAEIGELRTRYHQHTAQQLADPVPPGAGGAAPDSSRRPDVLAASPQSASASGAQAPESQQERVPRDPGEQPAPNAQPSRSAGLEADQDASGSALAGPPEPAGPASRIRRWIPELRRRRGQQPGAGDRQAGDRHDRDRQDGAGNAAPKTPGLIYLLILGDESSREEAALSRSRSALLEVDKKLAGLQGFAYQVRMLSGGEDGLRGDLRDAGRLGRRDVRRTVADADFAAVLESVRAALKRDRVAVKAAGGTTWPAVVFFTPEPPLADTVAAELFRQLAWEASIVWALPRSAKALLSGAFHDAPTVQVVADDQGVADEIAALLSSGADPVKAGA